MPMLIRTLLTVLMLMTLSTSIASAQNDPGSMDDLLDIEFAPLQPETQQAQPLPDLEAPLILGDRVELPPPPSPRRQSGPLSVLEVPPVTMDGPASGALVLPDLTMPTPENTRVDAFDRTSLKPRIGVQPNDRFELPPEPRLQAPRALSYGAGTLSSRPQFGVYRAPLQIEIFSANRGFGFQSYGGYRSGGYGYRPNGYGYGYGGGYRPYGGYRGGQYCPYGR